MPGLAGLGLKLMMTLTQQRSVRGLLWLLYQRLKISFHDIGKEWRQRAAIGDFQGGNL